MPNIRAIFRGSGMSVENTYYKRIKELEIENSALSRKVILLRKEVKQEKEWNGTTIEARNNLKQELDEIEEFFEHNDILHKELYQKILET